MLWWQELGLLIFGQVGSERDLRELGDISCVPTIGLAQRCSADVDLGHGREDLTSL